MNPVEPASPCAAPHVLALPADLGIERVGDLRAELLDLLDRAAPLAFEAGAVSRVHSASLQMLAAFCRDRRQAGHATRWTSPSDVLCNAADRLGLAVQLRIREN